MGLCMGVAVALQIISIYPKPEISFVSPPVDIEMVKSCDHLAVSRTKRVAKRTIEQRWTSPPNITICPSSNLSIYRLKKATQFWEALGHEFGSIRKVQKHDYNCATGIPSYNEILVQAVKALEDRLLTKEEQQKLRTYLLDASRMKIEGDTMVENQMLPQTLISRTLKDTQYVTSWIYRNIRQVLLSEKL